MPGAPSLSPQSSILCPALVARAPLRISFGGGGTDLPEYYERHGGLVVSAAIARYCTVALRDRVDGAIHIRSDDYGSEETIPPGQIPEVTEPLSLPKAVLEWFAARGLLPPGGLTLRLASEVPPGTGLGSSSAMAVALIRALATRVGLGLDAAALAELAARIEIARLGMPIGKQDQYASAFGGLNQFRFAAAGVTARPLGLAAATRRALEARLLLFSTGRSRRAAEVLCQQRARSAADPTTVATLGQLKGAAEEMTAALLAADLDRFGQLLDLAWRRKRSLSDRVSSPQIDRWYETALGAGAQGGKIAGAGGGGFLLLACPPGAIKAVRATMTGCGLRELPFTFDWSGASVGPMAGGRRPGPPVLPPLSPSREQTPVPYRSLEPIA